MKNYKSIICVVAAVCLLGTAAFCGFRIYHYYAEVDEQTEAFEEIAEMVEQAPTDETVPDDAPVSEGEDVLAKYQKLYLQNEDMVGWISIAGTTINYPVMQSRNNPNFYLKHNFEKEYSDLGTPYVQENCDIAESDNLVIYGHHIKGGKMFGALENYKSKSFYEPYHRGLDRHHLHPAADAVHQCAARAVQPPFNSRKRRVRREPAHRELSPGHRLVRRQERPRRGQVCRHAPDRRPRRQGGHGFGRGKPGEFGVQGHAGHFFRQP